MTIWKKPDAVARLEVGPLRLAVDVSAPSEGLSDVNFNGAGLGDCRLLQVHARGKRVLSDHYVRGRDVVARYAPGDPDHDAPEIYWRAMVFDEKACGIELILTAKTYQLRGETTTTIESDFSSAEVWWHGGDELGKLSLVEVARDQPTQVETGFLLYRLSERFSYAEMIYPSDFHVARLSRKRSGGINVRYELFPEPLEKGVIRRARVRGIFFERQVDVPRAIACYQDLARSAPPLTV